MAAIPLSSGWAQEPLFIGGLRQLPQAPPENVMNVSADGRVAVGFTGLREPFIWTSTSGFVVAPALPAGSKGGGAMAIDANGRTVVGNYYPDADSVYSTAFRWTAETGIRAIAPTGSSAMGVSADGSVLVGLVTSQKWPGAEAFRWTESEGLEPLGKLPGGDRPESVSYAVSADGQIVVGHSNVTGASADTAASQGFRWTRADGMVALDDLPGGLLLGRALNISPDGTAIVGLGTSVRGTEPVRWVDGTISSLDPAGAGYIDGEAWDASHEGLRIVGAVTFEPHEHRWAFIWDADRGMRKLADVLRDEYHLDLNGWKLWSALAITPDGSTIVGRGLSPTGVGNSWLARIGPVDADADQVPAWRDNCPTTWNPDQADVDGDGVGNVCDVCAALADPDQADRDSDGVGDACDLCVAVSDPDQLDTDHDGLGDACDRCPGFDDLTDTDQDGVADGCDNCPSVFNADQLDGDTDKLGDACDAPSLVAAVSRKQHGLAGEFDIPLLPRAARVSVESRAGGVSQMVLTFSEPIAAEDGLLDETEIALSEGLLGFVMVQDRTITLNLTGLSDGSCLAVALSGIADPSGQALDHVIEIRVQNLTGDVTGDRLVASADVTQVKARSGQSATTASFRSDINCDGVIASADITQVKARSGREATSCPQTSCP